MWKVIVIGILLIGAAFGIPSVRAKVLPPLMPVLEKLGPVGDAIGNPAKKWAARNEANMLIRKLAQDYSQTKQFPSPARFQVWIKQNTKLGKQGYDPWGRLYYLLQGKNQVTVGSNGPDQIRGNADDIRVTIPIQ